MPAAVSASRDAIRSVAPGDRAVDASDRRGRRWPIVTGLAGIVLVLTMGSGQAVTPTGNVSHSKVRRVLLVSYPATTWERVLSAGPPTLIDLLSRSAVASMSLRTIGRTTTAGEAYATIGAGNRSTADPVSAGQAWPSDASVEGSTAGAVFERRCGCSALGAGILHLGMPQVDRLNGRLLYGARPGQMGTTLKAAGHNPAVVANASEALGPAEATTHVEAALAVVDTDGRVAAGSVGAGLLVEDPSASFGVRTNDAAAARAVRAAWHGADVVLLEMSDLARVEAYASFASDPSTLRARAAAMTRADRLLGAVLADMDLSRDRVIIFSPTSPTGSTQLAIAAIAGKDIQPGLARSATTRRPGYVTLADIAPSVLAAFDVTPPRTVAGTAITSAGGQRPSTRTLQVLQHDNEVSAIRDRASGSTTTSFLVFQAVSWGLALLALTEAPRLRPVVAFVMLVDLALPSLSYLLSAVPYLEVSAPLFVVAWFGAATLIAVLATAARAPLRRRIGAAATMAVPLIPVTLTLPVLLVDVATGSRLQLNTVFGYSPTVAGRFAGWGNLTFAVVASSAIVAATGWWSIAAGRARRTGAAPVALLFAAVVAADGLPSLGSDVGGVLALIPAAVVVVLILAGRRVGSVRIIQAGLGAAAVLTALAALDLARPPAARTHLGRLAAMVIGGDRTGLATTLHRKLNANVSILTSSKWTWLVPAAVVVVAVLLWLRPALPATLRGLMPGSRACVVGTLVAGGLGLMVNDSGIAIPAMMLAVVLPYMAFLLLHLSATSDPPLPLSTVTPAKREFA